jgi:hypothetical protein
MKIRKKKGSLAQENKNYRFPWNFGRKEIFACSLRFFPFFSTFKHCWSIEFGMLFGMK